MVVLIHDVHVLRNIVSVAGAAQPKVVCRQLLEPAGFERCCWLRRFKDILLARFKQDGLRTDVLMKRGVVELGVYLVNHSGPAQRIQALIFVLKNHLVQQRHPSFR